MSSLLASVPTTSPPGPSSRAPRDLLAPLHPPRILCALPLAPRNLRRRPSPLFQGLAFAQAEASTLNSTSSNQLHRTEHQTLPELARSYSKVNEKSSSHLLNIILTISFIRRHRSSRAGQLEQLSAPDRRRETDVW